jgi:hypothetical protein
MSLQLVPARFFKEIDNLRASEKLAAVYDPGSYAIAGQAKNLVCPTGLNASSGPKGQFRKLSNLVPEAA